jgi:hypothetical protein
LVILIMLLYAAGVVVVAGLTVNGIDDKTPLSP